MSEKDLPPEILSQLSPEELARWNEQKGHLDKVITKSLATELEEQGLGGDSFEEARKREFDIKEGLDDAIETENEFSSETPLNKSGLPPCQRAKLENERNIQKKDPRLDK